MVWSWWRNRRRRQLLSQPFSEAHECWLRDNVRHYARSAPSRQSQLRDLARVFVAERSWESTDDLAITPEMQLTVGVLASLLVVDAPDELHYDHVPTVILRPDIYRVRNLEPNRAGVVTTAREGRLGEAWYRGPVMLSWSDVLSDARQESREGNIVLHEFAHQIDMLNGRVADGLPPLRGRVPAPEWQRVLQTEYQQLVRRCRQRQPGLIDCYGAVSPAEFFAVATETYFEQPVALRATAPDLESVFRRFYGPVE